MRSSIRIVTVSAVAALALTAAMPSALAARGTVIDDPRYVAYLPAELNTQSRYPAVIALGPDGDARAAANLWTAAAESRRWIVIGSKECRNDLKFADLIPKLEALLVDVQARYMIDPNRMIISGYAGGAMAAHALVFEHPEWSAAVVVNTGMLHPSFARQIAAYPRGRTAVFLASPTDFRYDEMQADRRFLEGLGWLTEWIEFEGGHKAAPAAIYEKAARWLEERMRPPAEGADVPKQSGQPGTESPPAAAKRDAGTEAGGAIGSGDGN